MFIPDGTPNSFKIIDKMNWTGVGLEVSRDVWYKHRGREEFNQAGVYILIGFNEESDLPMIYVGQGDGVKNRIESHIKTKDFWDRVLVFISSNGGLNRAHITWLEWALIKRAEQMGRCKLDNSNVPVEPILTEFEKADTKEFFNEILSILPLVEVKVFDEAKKYDVDFSSNKKRTAVAQGIQDTVIVPAQEEGFKRVFLGENRWYSIRIGGGKLDEIKYIAAYQTAPVSAITHYAEVDSIEAFGDGGKYQLNFKSPAKEISPWILFGDAKPGCLQGPRYTEFEKLKEAKTIRELLEN